MLEGPKPTEKLPHKNGPWPSGDVVQVFFNGWDSMHSRLLPGGTVVAGPPCSLHIGASSSVHQRSMFRPRGNSLNFKVRLSNRIWDNFAPWLHRKRLRVWSGLKMFALFSQYSHSGDVDSIWMHLDMFGLQLDIEIQWNALYIYISKSCEALGYSTDMHRPNWQARKPIQLSKAIAIRILMVAGRGLFYVIEQPAQSWAFKQAYMRDIRDLGGLFLALQGPLALYEDTKITKYFKTFKQGLLNRI